MFGNRPRPSRRRQSVRHMHAEARLARLWQPAPVSEQQARVLSAMRENATADEVPGVFDAWEVARRAGLVAELEQLKAAAVGSGWRELSVADLPTVGELPGLAPGGKLAGLLQALDRDGFAAVSDRGLVEVAAGAARLAAFAAGVQASAAAALVERIPAPTLPDGVVSESLSPARLAGLELAARLGLAPRTGHSLVEISRLLVRDLPDTLAALKAGRIDYRRARIMVDHLSGVHETLRRQVEARALPRAGRLATGALRALLDRLIMTADPDAAESRHQPNVAERGVRMYPQPDGMAEVNAQVAADVAATIMAALDAAAAAMQRDDSDDPRSVDARRADALAEMARSALINGHLGCCSPGCTGSGHPAQEPAHAAAAGPADAAQEASRHPAAGSSARPAGPAGDHRPDRCDGGRAASSGPAPQRLATRLGRRPVGVRVTVPFPTLAGLAALPGELDGYGPIPASLARKLAAGGVWRRLLTDPVTGALLDYGTTRYTPPDDLVDAVSARDRTCTFPGCRLPAHRCQIDHTTPAAAGGATAADNNGPLCLPHHLAKTHAGWTVEQPRPGRYNWTSPLGYTYLIDTDPVGPILDDQINTPTKTDPHPPDDPDPPPF